MGVDASVLMGGVEGEEAEDPWNVTVFMASFNLAEVTARYVDRLSREMDGAGRAVFGCLTGADEVTATKKLAVCRDDFEAARRALLQVNIVDLSCFHRFQAVDYVCMAGASTGYWLTS